MRSSEVPLFVSRVFNNSCFLVHGVEMEIVGKLVHPLHLLLPTHLEPLAHFDSQILQLLLQTQLGPFSRVIAFWARWVVGARHDSLATSSALRSKSGVKGGASVLTTIDGAIVVPHPFIARVIVDSLSQVFLSAPLPYFLLCQCVKSLILFLRLLDYSCQKTFRNVVKLFVLFELLIQKGKIFLRFF